MELSKSDDLEGHDSWLSASPSPPCQAAPASFLSYFIFFLFYIILFYLFLSYSYFPPLPPLLAHRTFRLHLQPVSRRLVPAAAALPHSVRIRSKTVLYLILPPKWHCRAVPRALVVQNKGGATTALQGGKGGGTWRNELAKSDGLEGHDS